MKGRKITQDAYDLCGKAPVATWTDGAARWVARYGGHPTSAKEASSQRLTVPVTRPRPRLDIFRDISMKLLSKILERWD